MFHSTPWSLVLQAADPATADGKQALGKLFEHCWYPLYAFLRQSGQPPQAAEDLLQGFFAKLIEKKMLAGISVGRGRFRNFLLVCLKRYVANERQKSSAAKRGGNDNTFQLSTNDREDADRRYLAEPSTQLTPERIYQRRWALAMLDQALAKLAVKWKEAGKHDKFEKLQVYLTGDSAPSHSDMSQQLGISTGAVKTQVHRIRAQFREILCQIVSETLDRDDLLEDELRQLFIALKV